MRPRTNSRLSVLIIGILILPVLRTEGSAQAQAKQRLRINGDVRPAYVNLHREDRNGATLTTDDLRARVRIGAGLQLNDAFTARVRFAGRFSTEQDRTTFYVREHPPTADGLRLGEATIDEAYLNYSGIDRLNVRVGRMQTKLALADLMGKSLDRVDSPNMDITWTDGAHITVTVPRSWNAHLILQHNPAGGSTNMMRAPLDLTASRSRISYFTALQNTTAWGPVVQRGVDLTYIPGSLRADGDVSGRLEDYVALVGRAALEWPVGSAHLLVGGEAGYAPNTPSRSALGLGPAGSGDVGGFAYQFGTTLSNGTRRHRLGLVYGHAEPGWLIAPDFRNNDRLIEGRYYWAFAPNQTFEARLRRRKDLEQLVTAQQRREDVDIYIRVTFRF